MATETLTPEQVRELLTGGKKKRKGKKGNKNRAVRTEYKGHWYASKLEASYAVHLDGLLTIGQISRWEPHPCRMRLICNGVFIGHYTPDFEVWDDTGYSWLVDTKGRNTREWPFRLKVIRACFPAIDLRIVHEKDF